MICPLTPPNSPQEKVEEDRFVRAQTKEQLEKIRQDATIQAAAAQANKDAKIFEEQLRPAMGEVKALLRTSEKLSDETVERIVRWRFGI
jgi:cell division septum initiation protein DivIVA